MNTRRNKLLLWLGYGGASFGVWFLSAGILSHFPLMGCVPDLIPVCIAFAAVLEGGLAGGVFGLLLGLFSWLISGEYAMILLGAVMGLLLGKLSNCQNKWLCAMFAALLALTAVEGLRRVTGGGSVSVAGWELVYSMLLALVVYPLFSLLHRRLSRD